MMKRRRFICQGLKTSLGLMTLNHGEFGVLIEDLKSMSKTDTHMHLFDLDHLKYPWLDRVPKINRSFSIDDFRAASGTSNVGKMIFMESGAAPEFALSEALWVAQLASKERRIKGIIAQLAMDSDIQSASDFQNLQQIGLLRGVRSKFLEDSKVFVNNLRILGARSLTFDLLLSATQLQSAARIAQQCEQTVFVLDHIGNPDYKQDTFGVWKEGIRVLAEQPNVCCKISGMISRIGSDWSLDVLKPYVMHVFEQFGPSRIIYGGDWPVVLLADSYRAWSNAFDRLLADFSKNERSMIYHKNADRIYNL